MSYPACFAKGKEMMKWKQILVWAVVLLVVCPLIARAMSPLAFSGSSPKTVEILVMGVVAAMMLGLPPLLKKNPWKRARSDSPEP